MGPYLYIAATILIVLVFLVVALRHMVHEDTRQKVRYNEPGYIYVFRGRWENPFAVKIGLAKDVEQRLRNERTGVGPYGMQVLAVRYVVDMSSAEKNIHRRFHRRRLKGEWFALSPLLWLYVTVLRTPHLTRWTQRKLEYKR